MSLHENPVAHAGATGAEMLTDQQAESSNPVPENVGYVQFSSQMDRIPKFFPLALIYDDPVKWADPFSDVATHISASARLQLASALWLSLSDDELAAFNESHYPSQAGAPLPPFFSPMDEARSWAVYASHAELEAYALACFQRMPAKRQAAFVAYISCGGA